MKRWMVLLLLLVSLLVGAGAQNSKSKPRKKTATSAQRGKHVSAKHAPAKLASAKHASPKRAPAKLASAKHIPAKSAPAKNVSTVGRAQMELAQVMTHNAYLMGEQLELRQRVSLLTRLLYTMRPEAMAAEKQQWAAELFTLAWQLPQETPEQHAARNATMATAAARMAVYDADRSLTMLDNEPAEANAAGDRADARCMAARLVFASYMQHHGAAGAQVLMAHARRWSEQGSFPYGATGAVLARLRPDGDAAEDYFRQEMAIFKAGREGLFGVSEFAGLLQQAAAMEAIYEDTAEEAGRAVGEQLRKLAGGDPAALVPSQKLLVVEALDDVRISAPKAYAEAKQASPELVALRAEDHMQPPEAVRIDPDLQASFQELAMAMREHRGAEELRAVIARGVQLVNAKYKAGFCAQCAVPDAQSWALVSLAAFAAPASIAAELNGIENPYWRAYFLAIAAQQVGQPTRVADPAARKLPGKEEAEPE